MAWGGSDGKRRGRPREAEMLRTAGDIREPATPPLLRRSVGRDDEAVERPRMDLKRLV